MKKLIALVFLLILLPTTFVLANEAMDLTLSSDIKVSSKAVNMHRLFDRDWDTYWQGEYNNKIINVKSEQPIHGLYICFVEEPKEWVLEYKIGNDWQSLEQPRSHILHQYFAIDGADEVHIKPAKSNKDKFGIKEIFLLGEGEVPGFVQQWQEPDGQADLMVFFAHPDDESLFFGGTLPYYAGELQLDVVAAAVSYATPTRRSELLNALWLMGVKNYPVFGPFYDQYSRKLDAAYNTFGKITVRRFVVELFRKYKPQVVVTHDIKGEYGHGMHMMVADASLTAFNQAADGSKYEKSAELYGTWQVQKLYLHLYPENGIVLDWDLPLSAFEGRTGFEMAQQGYLQHISQLHIERFKVEPRDSKYSSYHFGLAKSMVGPDVIKNDFMENIPTE